MAAGELGEVRKLANAEDPVCVRRGGPVCVRLVRLGELGEVRKLANAENPVCVRLGELGEVRKLANAENPCLGASCASGRARRGANDMAREASMGSTRGISLASPQNGTTANTPKLLPSTPSKRLMMMMPSIC